MKKLLLICVYTLLTTLLAAQVSKTVNVTTAGTLTEMLTTTEKNNLTNINLTGVIDARDIKCLRDEVINLDTLNLKEVNINEYVGTEGTYSWSANSTSYPSNELPQYSFYNGNNNNTKLRSISLPDGLNSIGYGAFFNCVNLSDTIHIPKSVNAIENQAFHNCKNLTTFIIPNSVTYIGGWAFSWCSALTSIYAYSTTPIDLSYSIKVFSLVDVETCKLYVPYGSKTLYESTIQWKDFKNIVEMNTTNISTITINNRISVYGYNSNIIIKGTIRGEMITVYTIFGKQIAEGKSEGSCITFQTDKNAVYLVRIDTKTYKVIL